MQQSISFWLWIAFGLATAAAVLYGFIRTVSGLYWKVVICTVPVVLSALIVGKSVTKYNAGEGGFKLGVDLVGGTILVYEIDPDRRPKEFKKEDLAAALKRRIDPGDLYNVTIRPVSDSRIEIILPTGSADQANKAEANWKEVLRKAQERYAEKLGGEELDVNRGQGRELMLSVQQKIETRQWANLKAKVLEKYGAPIKAAKDLNLEALGTGRTTELAEKLRAANIGNDADVKALIDGNYQPEKFADIEAYVNEIYPPSQQRKDLTGEEIQAIKQKIQAVGSMEFMILANQQDDAEVVKALQEFYDTAKNAVLVEELERRAQQGIAPPQPPLPEGETAWKTAREELGPVTYRWVEIGRQERKSLGLDNASEAGTPIGSNWHTVAADRAANRVTILSAMNQVIVVSRRCQSRKLSEAERDRRKFEYFLLCREPDVVNGERQSITGQDLESAQPSSDSKGDPAVGFTFNNRGGDRFFNVTSKNRPSSSFHRHLAIVLDDQIVSAPRLNEAIRTQGQISGNFTAKDVDQMVSILRSGALPATLKPLPVSENTIGPTLGQDTIRNGLRAVGFAFLAVLVFMCVYYRFAGFVASTALLANLLLTVAFMVFVNGTFTLPGLAGLVLMLGMAVDANVLIYERLREERERGANLVIALRNGYDRALPTILDTHLTSIFTAIVLYAVGNDQLKGFGVSLFSGLVISLFTSLLMTRTIFDLWMKFNLLKKLSMFRFFSRPSFDFMRIRHYWFAATIIFTIFGIVVFLWRGSDGLNIDFVGGTAYGGQLRSPLNISDLRKKLGKEQQETRLKVEGVEEKDDEGRIFEVRYAGADAIHIVFVNRASGATVAERIKNVSERASVLADWSVEQIFLSSESNAAGASRFFTVRTTEKEPDLVQVLINRLLVDDGGNSLLQKTEIEGFDVKPKQVVLRFTDYASPGYAKTLIARVLLTEGLRDAVFEVSGTDRSKEGRHKVMAVDLSAPALAGLNPDQIRSIFQKIQRGFNDRPQPERLENFDAQLAGEMKTKALWAILLSWAAILIYLWFRFGSWRFGLAAVLCLVHDLFFTVGIIGFCHYLVNWAPWLASIFKIDDFKIDLPAIAALLTLAGYSVNDTIVVFDRIREVRGKNPLLTAQMINDSVNQTLSRTLLASTTVFLVVALLYWVGGEGVHLFAFVMVVGVVIGTYSSIYIASPLLLMFGEGTTPKDGSKQPAPSQQPEDALA